MQTTDLVNRGVAKLLKKAGYSAGGRAYYNEASEAIHISYAVGDWNTDPSQYTAPTIAEAAKFLRDNYNLFVGAYPAVVLDLPTTWGVFVRRMEVCHDEQWFDEFPTYEAAMQCGLHKALEQI